MYQVIEDIFDLILDKYILSFMDLGTVFTFFFFIFFNMYVEIDLGSGKYYSLKFL